MTPLAEWIISRDMRAGHEVPHGSGGIGIAGPRVRRPVGGAAETQHAGEQSDGRGNPVASVRTVKVFAIVKPSSQFWPAGASQSLDWGQLPASRQRLLFPAPNPS